MNLSSYLKRKAQSLGFDLVGIAPAITPTGFGELQEWLRQGMAGAMEYIERREEAYEHPRHVLDGVRSVVVLGMNYRGQWAVSSEQTQESGSKMEDDDSPSSILHSPSSSPAPSPPTAHCPPPTAHDSHVAGRVARYARGSVDYHDLLRERLKALADFLHARQPGCRTRGVVDTAPLLERDFARLAGLGWFGKNTMLINKRAGSWLFLAALLTDVELEYDQPHETSHCGTCTRCLEACPTDAFPEPYVLDARRCISYLTIELRDRPIPLDLREGMGDWLFGCDICQEVCPWNRKAPVSSEPAFQPARDLVPADALSLLRMTADEFDERFGATPLARPGRSGMLRNAAIVAGNSGNRGAVEVLIQSLDDDDPLVRGAAAWALGRIGGAESHMALQVRLQVEDNSEVRTEFILAIEALATNSAEERHTCHDNRPDDKRIETTIEYRTIPGRRSGDAAYSSRSEASRDSTQLEGGSGPGCHRQS